MQKYNMETPSLCKKYCDSQSGYDVCVYKDSDY